MGHKQLTLWREEALCIIHGALCVVEVKPVSKGGCPLCKGKKTFQKHGWTWCEECGQFAILTKHLDEIAKI